MNAEITFFADAHDSLVAAMSATQDETVVFGFGGRAQSDVRTSIVVDRVEVVPDAAYAERKAGRFRLEPSYVAEVALRAAAGGRTLVVAHSHPFGRHVPRFSAIDDRMHRLLVPALLRQVPGPIASLVWSPGGWDGLLWDDAGTPHEIARVRVVGMHLELLRTGELAEGENAAYDRQIRAFGQPVQDALGSLRVGIVGLGGTGSLAAEWLAHMGVRDFLLVDPDRLEASNLSRVTGSRPDDVAQDPTLEKVASAERMIRAIAPRARIETRAGDVVRCDALRRVATCDVVLSCTDSHASRAVLNVLAYQYAIPLLDVGTLLRGDRGAVTGAWIDVRRAGPGTACLRCQDAIDSSRVTDELLSPAERQQMQAFGYVPGTPMPAPSVLPLNALGVSLLCLRVLDLLVPWLSWADRVTVEARALDVLQRESQSRDGCEICSDSALWGRADDLPLRCVG